MNETVKAKSSCSRGKTAALTTVCVLLVFVLTTLLLTSLSAHRLVFDAPVQEAFGKIPVEEVTLRDGTPLVTKISRDYIGGDIVKEETVAKVLQSKPYGKWVGEKAQNYANYIAAPRNSGEVFPEILTPEIDQLIRSTEDDIRLHTGIHDFMDNNPQLLLNLKPDLENWNHTMRDTISKGFTAVLLSAAVSAWLPYVLGGLLLLCCIWMLVIHVKGTGRVGSACKVSAVTAFVPSVLLLLWGMFGGLILKAAGMGYLRETAKTLRSVPLLIGGLACLACIALFIFGMLSNAVADAWASRPKRERRTADIGKKREMPAPKLTKSPVPETVPAAPAPALTEPEPAAVTRHFCRFCGGELVNSDAKFCYKCGKAQE